MSARTVSPLPAIDSVAETSCSRPTVMSSGTSVSIAATDDTASSKSTCAGWTCTVTATGALTSLSSCRTPLTNACGMICTLSFCSPAISGVTSHVQVRAKPPSGRAVPALRNITDGEVGVIAKASGDSAVSAAALLCATWMVKSSGSSTGAS